MIDEIKAPYEWSERERYQKFARAARAVIYIVTAIAFLGMLAFDFGWVKALFVALIVWLGMMIFMSLIARASFDNQPRE